MSALMYYTTAVAAALGTHVTLQYHEPRPIDFLAFLFLSNAALLVYLTAITTQQTPLLLQLFLNLIYTGTLILSITTYRLLLHRCRHFPGPTLASLSKFWSLHTASTGEYSRTVRALHLRHGDFVRVGPREIDICNVDAIHTIYGSGSRCEKGPWYDGSLMGGSQRFLQNELPGPHVWKRRVWDAGFNTKSIREYEPHVRRYIGELVQELRAYEGKVVDVGLYISFFTFDVMGDLGFGESFHMIKEGKKHDFMVLVQGYAMFNTLICTIPWCGTIFSWLPKSEAAEGLFSFAKQRVQSRLPLGQSRTDVFSHFLNEDRITKKKYTEKELELEAINLTLGGADTTSSSLATILYYLMAYPDKYEKLKAEIHPYTGPLDYSNLAKFPYLNGVIREALRLNPPVAGGMMHRVTPPEGIMVAGTHIPGNVCVGVGAYEVQRDARYFGKPDEFIPERWMGEGPLPFDRNANMVFSYGPYGCVGKQLAMVELFDFTAAMVQAFDMEFDPAYDVSSYEKSIKDVVISTRVYLPVILKARK